MAAALSSNKIKNARDVVQRQIDMYILSMTHLDMTITFSIRATQEEHYDLTKQILGNQEMGLKLQKIRGLLTWLYNGEPFKMPSAVTKSREEFPNCGQWVLDDPEYKNWISGQYPQLVCMGERIILVEYHGND